MRFKKLFGRKKQNRRESRATEFMLESLEPRLLLSATPMTVAVVTTDHLDYAPTETAVITTSNSTGDGVQFAAGELVRFQVIRTDGMADAAGTTADVGPAGNEAWYVIDGIGWFAAHLGSDVSGDGVADWIAPDNDLTVNSSINTTWFVEEQYRNSSLLVTATGQESGAVATQSFTDAFFNTTTTISSDTAISTYGDTVTFTATVTPSAGGTVRPAGSVKFLDNGVSLGIITSADLGSGFSSTFAITVSSLTAGSHTISAVFTGGTIGADSFRNSTSGNITQTVSKANAVVSVNGYFAEYDGTAHGATGTATGVGGVDLSARLNLGATFTNVADNIANWAFSGGTNYNDQTGTALIKIVKTDPTIVVNGFNAVYGSTPPGPVGTALGLFGSNSPPVPIRDYGTVLELSATGIANTSAAGLSGLDGFRHVDRFFSPNQDVTVTVTGAPATDSGHYLSVFLRTQNPNTGIVNAYYVTYEEAGTTGNWWVGRLIDNNRVAPGLSTGTHLAAGDKIRATVVGDTITAYSYHGGLWTEEISYTMTGVDVVSGPGYIGLMISGGSPEVNLTDVTGVFGAAAHGATGTAVGALGEPLKGLNLSGTIHTDAGTYVDTWTFKDSTGNYHDTFDGIVISSIAKADAAITVTGYDVTYDGAAHQATGTVLGVLGESLAGLSLSGTIHTNVGSYSDTWTFTDVTGNYNDTSGPVSNNINVGIVATTTAISSSLATSTYGNGVTFTATVSAASGSAAPGGTVEFFDGATSLGIVSTASSTGVGTSTWSLATAGLNAGSHAIHAVYTATGAFTGSSSVNMTQTVNKAIATVNVTGYTGIYDAAAHGATGTVSGVAGDLAATGSSLTLGAGFTNAPGGTASWSFAGGTNYTDQSGSVAIVITKAVATVSVTGYTGIYDATAHGATGTVSGVAGDLAATGSSLTLGAGFTNAPGGTASWSFAGGTNYTDQSGSVAIVITKAVATVSVTGYTGIYDATAHGATGTVSGVAGDLAATGSSLTLGASFTDAPGGTASWSFAGGTNYTDQSGSVAIVITKAVATVSVTGYTGIYDATAHGATGTVSGVAGDLAATGSSLTLGASFTDAPGGTASWSFTGGTNYTDQSGSVAIVITKAVATVSVTGYTGLYDAAAHGATIGGVTGVAGDLAATGSSLALGGETFTNAPGGTASWSFSGGTNYTDQSGSVAIVINKATVTLTGAGQSGSGYFGTYDGTAHAATVTVMGVGGVIVGTVTSSTTHTNGGTYSDTVTFLGDANYQAASKLVKSYILQATVTLTGAGQSGSGYFGTYDGTAHAATVTVTGVGGVIVGTATSSTTHTNVGTYSDTVTFLGNANYKAASKLVKSYILQATVTLTGAGQSGSGYFGTYDGTAHAATVTVMGVGGVIVGTATSSTTHTNVGTYSDTVTFLGNANYKAASKLVKSYILQATVTLTGAGQSGSGYFGTYDGTAHAATVTVTGVGGVIVGTVTSSTTHANAGTYSDKVTFLGNANYKAASKVVTSYILKATATITVTGYNVLFDGAAHTATGTVTGVGGVLLSGLDLSGTTHTSVGLYSDTVTFTGDANYKAATKLAKSLIR